MILRKAECEKRTNEGRRQGAGRWRWRSNTEEEQIVTEIYFSGESQTANSSAILMNLIVRDVTCRTDSRSVVVEVEVKHARRNEVKRRFPPSSVRFTVDGKTANCPKYLIAY